MENASHQLAPHHCPTESLQLYCMGVGKSKEHIGINGYRQSLLPITFAHSSQPWEPGTRLILNSWGANYQYTEGNSAFCSQLCQCLKIDYL